MQRLSCRFTRMPGADSLPDRVSWPRQLLCSLLVLVSFSTLARASGEPFKLGTFEHDGEALIGIVLRDRYVVDLARANASLERHRPLWVKLPMPDDMSELIGRYDYGMKQRAEAPEDSRRLFDGA